jgi:pilus assembly protein CpaC
MLSRYCAEMANQASVNQIATRVSGVLMRNLALAGSAVSSICVMLLTLPSAAETASPDGRGAVSVAPQSAPRALRGGGASQISARGAPLVLEVNKGTLIRLTAPAATVFIANPDIADVQVKSPSLIYLSAKSPGETVIYAVDASDSVLLNSPVRVEHDISRLRSSLRQLAPGEPISADSVDGNLVLSGIASDAGKADKVRALAASIAGEVKGSQVINRMTVATPNQVNLRVRVAEVNVTKLNEIGVNWTKAINDATSSVAFLTTNPVTLMAETTNNLRVGKLTGQSASALISALEQEGFITSLAEPNLTAMSGQTASFLAGGEFPVPISGSSTSTNGFPTITVEFKSFGVSLAFTPTVIDANHLNLRVRPEVSELSTVGEVSVPLTSTATVTIPALTVRRAETSVELGSGESFALAGLLMHTSQQLVSKVPWIGDIPILGALFRSDRFQRGETDLVVIVTPYLVQPVQTRVAAPTDGLQLPSDAQRVLFSDKYRQGLPGPGPGPLDAGGKGLIGPGGFRLD